MNLLFVSITVSHAERPLVILSLLVVISKFRKYLTSVLVFIRFMISK